MTRPRFNRILLACAFSAAGTAPALAAPPSPGSAETSATATAQNSQAASVRCDTLHAQPMNGVVSDPEEGGQVSARKTTGKGKVQVHDISVSKTTDKASTTLMESSAPAQSCASGQH